MIFDADAELKGPCSILDHGLMEAMLQFYVAVFLIITDRAEITLLTWT